MRPSEDDLATLCAHLEALWAAYEAIFATLTPSAWQAPFGREWTYADVPYHLAYFDREVVVEGIAAGDVAPTQIMHTHREFNDWNQRHLNVGRTQTPEHRLAQMRASRAMLRQTLAALADADLERPVWITLTGFGGQRSVRYVLRLCRMHTWMHLTQLCLRLRRPLPGLNAQITWHALNGIVGSLSPLLNRARSHQTRLAARLQFVGVPDGDWLIRVADGVCSITADGDAPADLLLSLRPKTFIELLSNIRHPVQAVLTGRLRVKGWRHLPAFLRLFSRPEVDQVLEPTL